MRGQVILYSASRRDQAHYLLTSLGVLLPLNVIGVSRECSPSSIVILQGHPAVASVSADLRSAAEVVYTCCSGGGGEGGSEGGGEGGGGLGGGGSEGGVWGGGGERGGEEGGGNEGGNDGGTGDGGGVGGEDGEGVEGGGGGGVGGGGVGGGGGGSWKIETSEGSMMDTGVGISRLFTRSGLLP